MVTNTFLTFRLGDVRLGIDATLVQEIVKLPEVSPIAEMPEYVMGIVNVRGKIIPVIDLNIRLGRPSPVYNLSDALLVLRQDTNLVAFIVNEVLEATELPATALDHIANLTEGVIIKHRLINTVAKTDSGLILLIDKNQLFHSYNSEIATELVATESKSDVNANSGQDKALATAAPQGMKDFFYGVSAPDQQEFRKRAQQLQKSLVTDEVSDSKALAVIKLATEYLAVELDSIEGFAKLAKFTQVPCCPNYILGCMNLRGDSFTVVDVSSLLNIHTAAGYVPSKVMLVKCEKYSLAVPIDDVDDIIHTSITAINKMPATFNSLEQKYLKGMVACWNKMLAVVDIAKLLDRDELVVCEDV
ncbi:hypothetical protein TI04_00930 [Achromatium sp. WMS2]|nr:hypothetical protein TI04_00930 [Achromatium sp. WMS2]